MLDFIVKTSALVVAGLIVSVLMRRSGPAARHAVLLATVLALVAMPIVTLLPLRWNVPVVGPQEERVTVRTHYPDSRLAPSIEVPLLSKTPPSSMVVQPVAPRRNPFDWAALLLPIYLAGFSLLALRFLVGAGLAWWRVRRAPEFRFDRLGELATRAGVRRVPSLRVVSGLGSPGTLGAFRPVIAVPAEAENWSSDQIEMALVHELAHIRRRDWVWGLAGELVRAVYWPDPLVWLLTARMRAESERACDEAVLSLGFSRQGYAETLLAIARGTGRPLQFASNMAQGSSIERRIGAILAYGRDSMKSTMVFGWTGALAILGSGIAVASAQQGDSSGPVPAGETRTDPTSWKVKTASRPASTATQVAKDGTIVTLSVTSLKTRPAVNVKGWNTPLKQRIDAGRMAEKFRSDPNMKYLATIILTNPRLANEKGSLTARVLGSIFTQSFTFNSVGKAVVVEPIHGSRAEHVFSEVDFEAGPWREALRLKGSDFGKGPVSFNFDPVSELWSIGYTDGKGVSRSVPLRDERGRPLGGFTHTKHPLLRIGGVFVDGSLGQVNIFSGAVIPLSRSDSHFKDLHVTVSMLSAIVVEGSSLETVLFDGISQPDDVQGWYWPVGRQASP